MTELTPEPGLRLSGHGSFQDPIWLPFCGSGKNRLGLPQASGLMALAFSSFALCSERVSGFLMGTWGPLDLAPFALLEGTETLNICPPAVGPWLQARQGVNLKAFYSHLHCQIPLIKWVTETGHTHTHTDTHRQQVGWIPLSPHVPGSGRKHGVAPRPGCWGADSSIHRLHLTPTAVLQGTAILWPPFSPHSDCYNPQPNLSAQHAYSQTSEIGNCYLGNAASFIVR